MSKGWSASALYAAVRAPDSKYWSELDSADRSRYQALSKDIQHSIGLSWNKGYDDGFSDGQD